MKRFLQILDKYADGVAIGLGQGSAWVFVAWVVYKFTQGQTP